MQSALTCHSFIKGDHTLMPSVPILVFPTTPQASSMPGTLEYANDCNGCSRLFVGKRDGKLACSVRFVYGLSARGASALVSLASSACPSSNGARV